MESLIKVANKIVHGSLFFFTAVLIFATGAQIILRLVFGLPLSWTEEVACYGFIWWVFFGAILGLRDRRHLGIDALVQTFPRKALKFLDMAIYMAILTYLVLMFYQGIRLVRVQMIHKTPITDIPLGWVIAIIPICAVLMSLYTIDLMCKRWKEKIEGQ